MWNVNATDDWSETICPSYLLLLPFLLVNPKPEAGSAMQIRLSEYRERVIDAASGNVMDVAAETFINLDYATGRFERFKTYRTVSPEQLKDLPILPSAAVATGVAAAVPTSSS